MVLNDVTRLSNVSSNVRHFAPLVVVVVVVVVVADALASMLSLALGGAVC